MRNPGRTQLGCQAAQHGVDVHRSGFAWWATRIGANGSINFGPEFIKYFKNDGGYSLKTLPLRLEGISAIIYLLNKPFRAGGSIEKGVLDTTAPCRLIF